MMTNCGLEIVAIGTAAGPTNPPLKSFPWNYDHGFLEKLAPGGMNWT